MSSRHHRLEEELLPASLLVAARPFLRGEQAKHDDLLFHYTGGEIRDHLAASQESISILQAFRKTSSAAAVHSNDEPWRRKLRSVVPAEGVVVKHIRTGEPVALSLRTLAVFLLMTVADLRDQFRLQFRGSNLGTMWPGSGKPGLCMNAMSRLAALYCLIAWDVEVDRLAGEEDNDALYLELVIPPVFQRCTVVLDPEDGARGTCRQRRRSRRVRDTGGGAAPGKDGSPGEWGRVMRDKATDKDWPTTALGVIGLVHDVKKLAPSNN
ncbi:hypothetical protein U9M48_000276 [Paspalum notatum var. saurae]|uniref:Uncharacterized protein n=1 Tax=Paspalum notatum var. saurae TaxID=547442 RepID=A0AAQ3PGS6_PASNO